MQPNQPHPMIKKRMAKFVQKTMIVKAIIAMKAANVQPNQPHPMIKRRMAKFVQKTMIVKADTATMMIYVSTSLTIQGLESSKKMRWPNLVPPVQPTVNAKANSAIRIPPFASMKPIKIKNSNRENRVRQTTIAKAIIV